MAQKLINVGTVANDGTGDTIRGAFSNVNTNFTEVYNNIFTLAASVASIDSGQNTAISSSYNNSNNAFDQANSANILAYSVGVSANLYSVAVGSSSNAYTVSVGAAGNVYTVSVGTAGNNYASILAANNAAGANAWANAVGVASNNWSLSTFTTLANTSTIFDTANLSFAKANAALANTTGVFSGNLTFTGAAISPVGFFDGLGELREKVPILAATNVSINVAHSIVIANSSDTMYIKIPDDRNFIIAANTGTKIDIVQLGSGTTKIIANDAAVTVNSSNNWSNISGQYLTASIVKALPNTWILTGDLKP